VVSDGCCNGCNGAVTGPYVPPVVGQPGMPIPAQPGMIPAQPGTIPAQPPLTPQPNPPIPRIDENVSPQNPWDPKGASRQGTPTNGAQVVPKN